MSSDLLLVLGTAIGALSLVATLTALIEGRRPRVASIVVMISGGLSVLGTMTAPDGFQLVDVPNAYIRVIADVLN